MNRAFDDRELLVVGIGGTTRPGSSTESALRVVLQEIAAHGASTRLFDGQALSSLPIFDPQVGDRSPEALDLISTVRRADAIVIGSPGYHGGVSGLVKNAVDYLEDLRDDDRVYLAGRSVGVVATGAGSQAVGTTLSALRDIVHALRGWVTPLGAGIVTSNGPVFEGGVCVDGAAQAQLAIVAREVRAFAEAVTSGHLKVA